MAVAGTEASQDADRNAGTDRRVTARRRRLVALVALTALAGLLLGGQATLPAGAGAGAGAVEVDTLVGPEHPVAPTSFDGPAAAHSPASAFDGANYLVVWQGLGGVRAARVDQSGTLLDPQPMLVAPGVSGESDPHAVFDGTNYLVVWSAGSPASGDIRGARVSTQGAVLDPAGFPIETGPGNDLFPVVSFDGTNSLVLWLTDLGSPSALVRGTRIDTGGNVVDPTPFVVPEANWPVSVAFDGINHLIAWAGGEQGGGGVKAVQMRPDGTVLAPGVIQVSAPTLVRIPAVVFDGVHWQVAWPQSTPDGYDIHGARLSRMGQVLDPADIVISAAPGDQGEVSIARNGTHVLVAWIDPQQDFDVLGARVSRPGVVLDPAPIAIATGPGRHYPVVLATGTNNVLATFVADWGDSCCTAQAVRVSRAGAVLDPAPHLVSQKSNSQGGGPIAFDGTNHLVAWNDDRAGSEGDIYAARITADGRSLDPAGFIVDDSGTGVVSDVAFDGTNYVIVWSRSSPQGDVDVLGAIVSPDAVVLTPTPIPIAVAPDRYDAAPTLSPDGTNTMVLWSAGDRFLAARLSPSGEVLDPGGIEVTDPAEGAWSASIAFDGTNHLVVYTTRYEVNAGDIMARRLSRDATVVDPTALPIATSPTSEMFPDVAWSGRSYLVVWENRTFDPSAEWVEAVRVGTDGRVLPPGTVRVSVGNADSSPNVAALNGWFLIAWTSRRETLDRSVVGTRIHENGSMPDRSGFTISDTGLAADIAAGDDGRWRTVYSRNVGPPTTADRVFLRTVAPK